MKKHLDLLPEEAAAQNQVLIQKLRQACTMSPEDARSLDSIRARLRVIDEQRSEAESRGSDWPSRENQQPSGLRRVRSSPTQPRRSWKRALSLVAVLLVTVLLFSALSLAVNRMNQLGGHVPTPTVPTHVTSQPTRSPGEKSVLNGLDTIHMIDTMTGWTSGAGGNVLRTTDGGVHWQDVTPPAIFTLHQDFPDSIGENSASVFLDASTAWIALSPHLSLVFHTMDGGRTWTQASLQTHGSQVEQLVFLNAYDGWLRASSMSATYLYQTHNSGKTWTQIFDSSNTQTADFRQVAFTGMSFANSQAGLLIGNKQNGNSGTIAVLYRTEDGGASWTAQTGPLPTYSGALRDFSFEQVQFFTSKDALLPATFSDQSQRAGTHVVVFATHDAGLTWNATPVQPTPNQCNTQAPGRGYFSPWFLNMQYGWAYCEKLQGKGELLYSTSDGGFHWTQIQSFSVAWGVNSGLNFSSQQIGWLLTTTAPGTKENTVLYKSIDGGYTWKQVQAHFPAFIEPPSAF